MPCVGGPSPGQSDGERLDVVTRLLCRACKLAEAGKSPLENASVLAWWEAHKLADAKRVELERLSRQRQRERMQVDIDRLTALIGDDK